MAARRITTVTVPVGPRSAVALESYPARTPLLSILAARPGLVVTLTLPERIDAGHVRFARDLARSAARYAAEVERSFRGLPVLPARAAGSAG
jgi:hypothetical protein